MDDTKTNRTSPRPPTMLDLLSPRYRADPHPLWAALRKRSPFSSADGSSVVVGRYEDCARVLRDPAMSSRQFYSDAPQRTDLAPSFLVLDPPDHTRLRRLVSRAFSPRVVAALAASIVDAVDSALDHAADRGHIDVVAALAEAIPIQVICRLLGIAAEDTGAVHEWSSTASLSMDPYALADTRTAARIAAAEVSLESYFRRLIRRRRAAPGTDLISGLLAVVDGGERLSGPELLATVNLVLIAGHETVTNLIGNGILALLRHPSELTLLRTNEAAAGAAVEEALRFDAPVQMTSRLATAPTMLGGTPVPAGARVNLLLAAANRDPHANEDPDRFRIDRPRRNHLGFSLGPHFCLGAGLGRLECATVFRRFAARIVAPRIEHEASVVFRPHINLRGPGKLIVHFDGIRPREV